MRAASGGFCRFHSSTATRTATSERRRVPLSPGHGAFFLLDLDRAFERTGLFYVRFIDDIVVLAPTRWRLRAAVRQVHQTLASLGLSAHPDKTFIGRVERVATQKEEFLCVPSLEFRLEP